MFCASPERLHYLRSPENRPSEIGHMGYRGESPKGGLRRGRKLLACVREVDLAAWRPDFGF